jgi:hypothetical protein
MYSYGDICTISENVREYTGGDDARNEVWGSGSRCFVGEFTTLDYVSVSPYGSCH